jgi:hypothetical protein
MVRNPAIKLHLMRRMRGCNISASMVLSVYFIANKLGNV